MFSEKSKVRLERHLRNCSIIALWRVGVEGIDDDAALRAAEELIEWAEVVVAAVTSIQPNEKK